MEGTPLEQQSLLQFDDLVSRGELLWQETRPEIFECKPFDIEFRIAHSFEKKPIAPADDRSRYEDSNAFADNDPAFFVGAIGAAHSLILNKYCVVRPQFVLHTKKFERQSDMLFEPDFEATWQAMNELGAQRYMAIFNCGAKSGSSVGHKHMQLLPRSEHRLFPDQLISKQGGDRITADPEIPFQHAIQPLSTHPSSAQVFVAYETLCKELEVALGVPHNMILTCDWLMVVPRTKAHRGEMAANALGMVGMIWVNGGEMLESWKRAGPMDVITEFGVPWPTARPHGMRLLSSVLWSR